MAKYSFTEECDNLDKLAQAMRENLQYIRISETYESIRSLAELAKRVKRKWKKYENFYENAILIGGSECYIQKPLDEDCGRYS